MNAHLNYLPDRRVFRYKDVQMCRCDSTENKLLIQISKYKYNRLRWEDVCLLNKKELSALASCFMENTFRRADMFVNLQKPAIVE